MGKKNKLKKFAEVLSFQNVFENLNPKIPGLYGENGAPVDLKGKWNSGYFNNNHQIILELACGRGEYTLALAQKFPDKNFIGVDIKGARIWKGARRALDQNLSNVAFLRTRIEQIASFFAPGEVREIWITFPDPFLKKSKSNKRLTSSRFLSLYRNFLKPEGLIHLKTDEPNLYQFTLENIEADKHCSLIYHNDDIYKDDLFIPELAIQTYYEEMHLEQGKSIKYIQFTLC